MNLNSIFLLEQRTYSKSIRNYKIVLCSLLFDRTLDLTDKAKVDKVLDKMAEVYKECKPKEEKDTPVAEVRQKLVKRILDKKNPEVHATVCIEEDFF